MMKRRSVIIVIFLTIVVVGAVWWLGQRVKTKVEQQVENVVIEKKESGGWTPFKDEEITPDFKLYEDRTVVYKKFLSQDKSKVEFKIGQLTATQVFELVKFVRNQRFFEMKAYYPSKVMDAVTTTIRVRTKDQSKIVKVDDLGPKGFKKIRKRLDEFDIENAQKYQPKKITVFVYTLPQENLGEFNSWPVKSVDLEQISAAKRVTLKGDDLRRVMEAMQNQIWRFFSYDGKAYEVRVKIHFPGV